MSFKIPELVANITFLARLERVVLGLRGLCTGKDLAKKMVIPAGFEPATFRLGGGRSIQLSYGTEKSEPKDCRFWHFH